jgi:hypothetical protein
MCLLLLPHRRRRQGRQVLVMRLLRHHPLLARQVRPVPWALRV